MKLYEVQDRNSELLADLVAIWEKSVKATHIFLSDEEILKIKAYVPSAIQSVAHLVITEDDSRKLMGFMGVQEDRLEMLFLSPEIRGQGIGGRLLQNGIQKYGVRELTVNEQNPQAIGFYEHMGFETYKRTDTDEEGNPYPLLYMKLR